MINSLEELRNSLTLDDLNKYYEESIGKNPEVDKIEITGFPAQTAYMKEELSTILETCYSNKNIEIEVI